MAAIAEAKQSKARQEKSDRKRAKKEGCWTWIHFGDGVHWRIMRIWHCGRVQKSETKGMSPQSRRRLASTSAKPSELQPTRWCREPLQDHSTTKIDGEITIGWSGPKGNTDRACQGRRLVQEMRQIDPNGTYLRMTFGAAWCWAMPVGSDGPSIAS